MRDFWNKVNDYANCWNQKLPSCKWQARAWIITEFISPEREFKTPRKSFFNKSMLQLWKRKERECFKKYFRFFLSFCETEGNFFSFRFFYKYDGRLLPFSLQISFFFLSFSQQIRRKEPSVFSTNPSVFSFRFSYKYDGRSLPLLNGRYTHV